VWGFFLKQQTRFSPHPPRAFSFPWVLPNARDRLLLFIVAPPHHGVHSTLLASPPIRQIAPATFFLRRGGDLLCGSPFVPVSCPLRFSFCCEPSRQLLDALTAFLGRGSFPVSFPLSFVALPGTLLLFDLFLFAGRRLNFFFTWFQCASLPPFCLVLQRFLALLFFSLFPSVCRRRFFLHLASAAATRLLSP